MATGRDTKLTGATGEYLVAAESCRRGLVAAPFAGNVPHDDVIASDPRGGHLAVQVKTIRGSSWQFDVRTESGPRFYERVQGVSPGRCRLPVLRHEYQGDYVELSD